MDAAAGAAATSRIDRGFAVAKGVSAAAVAGAAFSTDGTESGRDAPFADALVVCCALASTGFGASGAGAAPELGVAEGASGCASASDFATAAVAATSETDDGGGGANDEAAAAAAAAAEVGVDAAAATAAADAAAAAAAVGVVPALDGLDLRTVMASLPAADMPCDPEFLRPV